jgi:5-methylcytosine-specific restriction endonuclease McrA
MPPAGSASGAITAQTRRPSWWVGAWRARAVTAPGVAALAGASALSAYTPLPGLYCAGVALAGVAAIATARRPPAQRIHEAREGVATWREGRGRFRTEYRRHPDDYPLPGQVEGRFALGRGWPGLGLVYWSPGRGDGPHLLIAGQTDSGKSRTVNSLLHQARALWGWRRLVIDGKPGNEYRWLRRADGDQAVVRYTDADLVLEALRGIVQEMHARYAYLDQLDGGTERDWRGVEHESAPLNWWELTPTQRAEWPPLLLVVDEVASAITTKDQKELLRELVQLGRSVGIHLILAMQRPDAEYLPGFIKAQTGGRILVGPTFKDRITLDMVIGEIARAALEASEAPVEPVKGRAAMVDVGGPGARVLQLDHLDPVALMPRVGPGAGGDEAARTATAPGSPGAGGPSQVVGDLADPDSAEPATSGSGDGVGGGRWALWRTLRSASGDGSRPGEELRSPPGAASPTASRRAAGGSAPPASPAPSPTWRLGLVGAARRLHLVGPLARVRLRLTAWRLVVADRVRPGPRPPGLRGLVEARAAAGCSACGADVGPTSGGWECEHTVPRWAGGSDDPANLTVMCRACHRAKTRAEARVRRWRDRWLGAVGVAERLPSYLYNGVAALVVGVWTGVVGGPGATVLLVAAGAVIVYVLRYLVWAVAAWPLALFGGRTGVAIYGGVLAHGRRVRQRGIDGLATLDNVMEQAGVDTVADAARAQRNVWRWKAGVRLQLVVVALAFLAARALVWWARVRLGV